jgi:hypothetical protein
MYVLITTTEPASGHLRGGCGGDEEGHVSLGHYTPRQNLRKPATERISAQPRLWFVNSDGRSTMFGPKKVEQALSQDKPIFRKARIMENKAS